MRHNPGRSASEQAREAAGRNDVEGSKREGDRRRENEQEGREHSDQKMRTHVSHEGAVRRGGERSDDGCAGRDDPARPEHEAVQGPGAPRATGCDSARRVDHDGHAGEEHQHPLERGPAAAVRVGFEAWGAHHDAHHDAVTTSRGSALDARV